MTSDMNGTAKPTSRLSTFTLVIAGATFVFWQLVWSDSLSLRADLRHCPAEINSGFVLEIIAGMSWLVSALLSIVTVVLEIVSLRLLSALKGFVAAGLVLVTLSTLPEADSMRIPDSSAVATLRTINIAEVTYLSTAGAYGTISDLISQGLIDARYGEPPVDHYTYHVAVGTDDYVATASPISPVSAASGCWEYYSKENGVLLYSMDPQKAPRGRAGMPLD